MSPNCTHTDLLIQNYSNFNKTAVPARFMFYESGCWSDFNADVSDRLREAFADRTAVVEASIGGVDCLFDFYRMIQVRLDNGEERSLAWIDMNGGCFFPMKFIDGNGRFDGGKVVENCQEVVSPRWPKARVLREKEKAYETVKGLFLAGMREVDPGAVVTGVHQVGRPGPLDQARMEVFRKQMEILGAVRGKANMTFAWHGTSEKGVELILRHGFSGPSKVEGDEARGVGAYLSPVRSAHSSAMLAEVDGNGEKHVILCRVLLGKCEKVEAGSKQMYPSSVDFDTGVDDLVNPKWYVVWGPNMNTHIIPECVVSYRPSNCSPGQSKGSPVVKPFPNCSPLFAKLIPKLSTSLPSAQAQEFRTLCRSYKDGKMAKAYFLKQLRSVVGDEMLVSAIREGNKSTTPICGSYVLLKDNNELDQLVLSAEYRLCSHVDS